MTRGELIDRIRSLSEDEVARVAPYIEADLDALVDLEDLREEVRRGRASAVDEALLSDEDVLRSLLQRLTRDA
jgi:hypothetical protein